VVGFCKLCNEPLGSVKCREFQALELLASQEGAVLCGVMYDLTFLDAAVFRFLHSFGVWDFVICSLHVNFSNKLRSGFKPCFKLVSEE
jgi:hypothetical protein